MRFLLVTLICLFGIAFNASAQKVNKPKNKAQKADNSFEPFRPEEVKAPVKKSNKKRKKSFSSKYNKTLEEKREEFAKRMEANAKSERKKQRQMIKPQYSDPSYFGHKNKPKKRKPSKRKFCKECGIVH
ncbi:hypothetical protein JMN32_25805 [Fulvivirga sp. 29W222]|uniref:Uncharacterized protein n=1 Tax=Fulvivirga marina TaxID=2494733 RepID=A0A937G305_9BACT|nr:hypothetical protein [Fulvivirga marina]MBL6449752.1 hypothetical protein [Fulvivirga marina]